MWTQPGTVVIAESRCAPCARGPSAMFFIVRSAWPRLWDILRLRPLRQLRRPRQHLHLTRLLPLLRWLSRARRAAAVLPSPLYSAFSLVSALSTTVSTTRASFISQFLLPSLSPYPPISAPGSSQCSAFFLPASSSTARLRPCARHKPEISVKFRLIRLSPGARTVPSGRSSLSVSALCSCSTIFMFWTSSASDSFGL